MSRACVSTSEVHYCSPAQAPTHMACRRLQRFTGAGDGLTVYDYTLYTDFGRLAACDLQSK